MIIGQVPVAPRDAEVFSQKTLMAVQVLVLHARGLIAQTERDATFKVVFDEEEFSRLVQQLMAQRRLSEEILADEIDQSDPDTEVDGLRGFLDKLCRETESAVLAAQAKLARASGDEALAARIENLFNQQNTR